MPKNFTGVLGAPQNPTATREQYVGNLTEQAGQIADIAETAGQFQDQRILSSYQDDLLASQPNTSEYNNTLRDLNSKLYDASSRNDTAAMTEYMGQMEKLRRGEMTGIMSPTAASLRLQMLTKEWANRYPHLADKFKQLYNSQGAGGYGGTVKAEEDPYQKGMNDVLQESARTGKTVAAIWAQQRLRDDSEALDLRVKIKERQGDNIKPEMEKLAFNLAQGAVLNIPDNLAKAAAAGTLDGEEWGRALTQVKDNLRANINDMFTEKEKSGAVFGFDYKKQVTDNALSIVDDWITAAKNADSSDKAARLAKNSKDIVESGFEAWMKELLGYRGVLMIKYPESVNLIADMIKADEAFRGGGGKAAIFKKLAQDNPRAAAVAAMLGDGTLGKLMLRNLGFTISGTTPGTLPGAEDPLAAVSPEVRKLVVSGLGAQLSKPGWAPEDYAAMVVRMAQEAPDQLAKNAAGMAHIQNIPGLRERVDQSFANSLVAFANEMDPHEFDLIQMSGGSGDPVEVNYPKPDRSMDSLPGADPATAAFMYPAIAKQETAHVSNMAALLNSYYEVLVGSGVAPDMAKATVGKNLAGVIQMRTDSANRPTAAQQAQARANAPTGNKEEDLISAVMTAVSGYAPGDKADRPTGKRIINAQLASRLIKELSGVDDPTIEKLDPGIYRDTLTNQVWKITNSGLTILNER